MDGKYTSVDQTVTTGESAPIAIDANRKIIISPSSTSSPLNVSGGAFGVGVSFNRTSDTNVYAALDVLGSATGSTAAMTFASIGRSGGGEHLITSASLEIDVSAVPSGMTNFKLKLYSVTPPSALGDNAAWDLPSGDRASYLGEIDLGTPVDVGSTLYVQTDQIGKQVTIPSGGSLFAYLVTVSGYTPASGTTHKVTLHTAAL